jgi:3-oxoadipate enol-lactonase
MKSMTTGTIRVTNGELAYEIAGTGPAVVLLHAGNLDSRAWDPQFTAIAEQFTVIRYDARNHGSSSTAQGPYSHFEDLRDLMQGMSIDHGSLVGLSLGARTAIDFGLAYPEMVDSLVLGSPGISGMVFSDPVVLDYLQKMIAAITAGDLAGCVEWFLRSWVDGPNRKPDQVDPAVREHCREMAASTIAAHAAGAAIPPTEVGAIGRVGELRTRTLVMVGEADSSDIHRTARRLADQVPGAERFAVPGAGHCFNLEQPEIVTPIVFRFLQGQGRWRQ